MIHRVWFFFVCHRHIFLYVIVGYKYMEVYMKEYDVYSDISRRTNGEMFIGVVGPVRTGRLP